MRIARLFLACLPLLACVTTRPSAIRAEERGPVLFTVTHPDKPGAKLSILGTVHLARTGFRLDRAVERTVEEAEQLFVEIDQTPELEKELQAEALRLGVLPEGQTLETQVKPETYASFLEGCQKLQLNPTGFAKFRPWFLSLTLTVLAMQRANPDLRSELGLDKRVSAVVRAKSKTITSLESAGFQLALLSSGDAEQQEKRLAATLKGLSKPETARKLFAAYEEGDLGTLEKLTVDASPAAGDFTKRFWTDRNVAMFEKLKTSFGASSPQVVAVGAGHLLGDSGLVRLFEKAGYVVERAKSEGPGAEYVPPWFSESGPGFSLAFPGKPTRRDQRVGDDGETSLWLWQGGTRAYALEVTRSPALGTALEGGREYIFNATIDALAKGRTLTKSELLTLAGRPALHAVMDGGTPSVHMETWVLDSGNAVISLRAVWAGPATSVPQDEFDRFFQGLKLK